jgi:hypothetical protein
MHLSAKQFAEILSGLGNDVRDSAFEGHKRRAHRVELTNRVTIIPDVKGEDAQAIGVELRDFSPRGIRFLYSKPLPAASQFVLKLPQTTGEPIRILCSVIHSRRMPEGPVSIGAEFTCVLRVGKPPKAETASAAVSATERHRIRQSILD